MFLYSFNINQPTKIVIYYDSGPLKYRLLLFVACFLSIISKKPSRKSERLLVGAEGVEPPTLCL